MFLCAVKNVLKVTSVCRTTAHSTRTKHTSAVLANHHAHVHSPFEANSNMFAVSYLSANDIPPSKSLFEHPDLIIGWTPSANSVDPHTFQENEAFVNFMSKIFSKDIHRINDSALKGLAKWQKEGWLHIGDERNPPPWGRIPSPEDIIGMVLLKNGEIQPDSYQPMPTHRLVTTHGLFQLSEPLRQCIIDAAKKQLSP